jgi:hypothetical protein
MEDFDEMTTYGFNTHQGPPQPNYASAPPRYARKQSRYGPQQQQQQTRFGGNFVDPVEQLRLLLQAAPFANAPPALAYQVPAQVHVPAAGQPPPAQQQPLNLGAAANAVLAAANPWKKNPVNPSEIKIKIQKWSKISPWFYRVRKTMRWIL